MAEKRNVYKIQDIGGVGEVHISDEVIAMIHEGAKQRTEELLGICPTRNINYIEYPAVFFGGGALLLRKYIEENKQPRVYEFIEDVNGNAKAYADFLE